jgi:hypothetical protein
LGNRSQDQTKSVEMSGMTESPSMNLRIQENLNSFHQEDISRYLVADKTCTSDQLKQMDEVMNLSYLDRSYDQNDVTDDNHSVSPYTPMGLIEEVVEEEHQTLISLIDWEEHPYEVEVPIFRVMEKFV